jgi:hypothetical protein
MLKKLLKFKSDPEQEALPGIELPKKIETRKQKQSKKNGRWAIVIIFIITVILSLIFYLKTEIPNWWQRITSPVVISTYTED